MQKNDPVLLGIGTYLGTRFGREREARAHDRAPRNRNVLDIFFPSTNPWRRSIRVTFETTAQVKLDALPKATSTATHY